MLGIGIRSTMVRDDAQCAGSRQNKPVGSGSTRSHHVVVDASNEGGTTHVQAATDRERDRFILRIQQVITNLI